MVRLISAPTRNASGTRDPRTNELIGSIHVGRAPFTLAVGGGSIWVLNTNSGSVTPLDARTGTTWGPELRVGGHPSDIAFAGNRVWVTDPQRGLLLGLAPRSPESKPRVIRLAGGPVALAAAYGSVWVREDFSGALIRVRL